MEEAIPDSQKGASEEKKEKEEKKGGAPEAPQSRDDDGRGRESVKGYRDLWT